MTTTSIRNLPSFVRLNKFFILAALTSLCGFIGFLAHIPLMYSTSYPIVPVALDMYLAALNGVFGLEALWWEYQYHYKYTKNLLRPKPSLNMQRTVYIVTVVSNIIAALLFILYIIGYRLDAAFWCIPLGIAFGIITYRMRTIYSSLFEYRSNKNTVDASLTVDQSIDNHSLLPSSINDDSSRYPSSSDIQPVSIESIPVPWKNKLFSWTHNLGWCIAITFFFLLLGGAGTIAHGWRTYLPRGKFYTVSLPLTKDPSTVITQSIHVYCDGPYNKSLPIVFIEIGGGGHSTSDMYGLINYLTQNYQRRVCSYDFPGTGWSRLDIPLDDPVLFSNLPLHIVDAIETDEPAPYIVMGTMDDAPQRAYNIALQRPNKVVGLVPIQYGYGEFPTLAAFNHWTPQQTAPVVSATLTSRRVLGDIIRYLGIQWGLMQFLIGGGDSSTYVPKALEPEKNFLNLFHEGQWDLQVRILQSQVQDPINTVLVPDLWIRNRSLSTIPVLALACFPTDLNEACTDSQYPLDSDDCRLLQYTITLNTEFMRNMTTMTPGSVFLNFNYTTVCDSSLLGTGGTINMVGDAVMNRFGNIYVGL